MTPLQKNPKIVVGPRVRRPKAQGAETKNGSYALWAHVVGTKNGSDASQARGVRTKNGPCALLAQGAGTKSGPFALWVLMRCGPRGWDQKWS